MDKRTRVINLIGGPGSGKSTTAAGLFYALKTKGYDCEMVLEFAKDKVWEETVKTLDDQIYIFGKQYHKIWYLNNKVDYIITDSPLLLSSYYNQIESDYFNDFIIEQFNRFDNLTFFIKRNEDHYEQNGRLQNLNEVKEIDIKLRMLLENNDIDYYQIEQKDALNTILEKLNIQ